MRINQVRDFLAVIEHGSLRAAARSLNLSQPALTKSIRALEQQLGVPLLTRTTRGVVSTRFGRAFLARAQVIQSELRKADEDFQQLAGSRGGSVAFGFGPVAAKLVVPDAVAEFRRQQPGVRLRLNEGLAHTLVPMVRDETLDFALSPRLPGSSLEPAIKFRPLFRQARVVVARKGHPLARAGSLARMVEASWLSWGPLPLFERMFTAAGLTSPGPAILCESPDALFALLGSTDMLAVVPRDCLLAQPGNDIQEVAVREAIPSFTFGLFQRADAPLRPAASALAKLVIAESRRLAARR